MNSPVPAPLLRLPEESSYNVLSCDGVKVTGPAPPTAGAVVAVGAGAGIGVAVAGGAEAGVGVAAGATVTLGSGTDAVAVGGAEAPAVAVGAETAGSIVGAALAVSTGAGPTLVLPQGLPRQSRATMALRSAQRPGPDHRSRRQLGSVSSTAQRRV